MQNEKYELRFEKNFAKLEDAVAYKRDCEAKIKQAEDDYFNNMEIKRDAEGVAIIPVWDPKSQEYVYARVDYDMYRIFIRDSWYLDPEGYARRSRDGVRMHQLVLPNNNPELSVDHIITKEKLHNRRSNLRLATRPMQGMNQEKREGCTSSFKGVYKTKSGKWQAQIVHRGVQRYLGIYDDEEEAGRVSKKARAEVMEIEVQRIQSN